VRLASPLPATGFAHERDKGQGRAVVSPILNSIVRTVEYTVRDQAPMARLRGIYGKRRILTEGGGLLSAEKGGRILHDEPTGGGETAKGGKAHWRLTRAAGIRAIRRGSSHERGTLRWGENRGRYFCLVSKLWRLSRVDGLRPMAEPRTRALRMKRVHRPGIIQSPAERLVRACGRDSGSTGDVASTDSATTERSRPFLRKWARLMAKIRWLACNDSPGVAWLPSRAWVTITSKRAKSNMLAGYQNSENP